MQCYPFDCSSTTGVLYVLILTVGTGILILNTRLLMLAASQ